MSHKDIAIFAGSSADLQPLAEAMHLLESFDINFHVFIASAHRTPEYVAELVRQCEIDGVQVVMAAAGHAAHLAGLLASKMILPVIGIPMASSSLKGVDSLYSTVMMSGGIPVASMGIGSDGAENAALFALEIIALNRPALREQLLKHRHEMKEKILKENENLSRQGWKKFIKK